MGNRSAKTEHAGAKNGGGHWGPRAEAKEMSNSARRAADKAAVSDPDETCVHQLAYDLWTLNEPIDGEGSAGDE